MGLACARRLAQAIAPAPAMFEIVAQDQNDAE
jgi:hypothetical protein